MGFDLQVWKQRAAEALARVRARLHAMAAQDAPNLAYGTVCAYTLLPVIQAVQGADLPGAAATLGGVTAGMGVHLLSNLLERWRDKATATEDDAIRWAAEQAGNEVVRQELDEVLAALDAMAGAQAKMNAKQATEFARLLRPELGRLGNLARFEASLHGSGAVAQASDRAVAAGKKGFAVGGDLHGDIQTGGTRIDSLQAATVIIADQRTAAVPDQADGALVAEQAYLRRMLVTRNVLPLGVIDPRAVERAREKVMDLVSVYVDLDTTTQVQVKEEKDKGRKGKRDSSATADRAEEKTRPLGALEAAALEPVLVLLGDPGSGKTTFAHHLALCLAGARLERLAKSATPCVDWMKHLRPGWTHGDLLPVCVRLRDFAASEHCDGTARGLLAFIEKTLDDDKVGEFAPVLHQRLGEGGVLVILDGLDEVAEPGALKHVRDAVSSFAGLRQGARGPNRFLVTCRVYAYQEAGNRLAGVPYHTLAPFSPRHIEGFIESWHREVVRLGWKSEADAQELKRTLHEAVGRPDLAPLAANPLQLTMMALLQFSYGRLPEDRVELYNQMVELLLVRWQEARMGADAGISRQIKLSDLKAAMARVAFEVHRQQGASSGMADISEGLLVSVLKDYLDGSYERARQLVTFIQQRADLLVWRSHELYAFPHRSYQEFLAGTHLSAQGDFPDQLAALVQENYRQWREVALWAVEVAARAGFLFHGMAAVEALCPRDVPAEDELPDEEWRAASLAGEGLLGIGLQRVQSNAPDRIKTERVRQWLTQALARGALPAIERAEAGRVLAKLGDPRSDVLTLDAMRFCLVPGGRFWMGGSRYNDEKPAGWCEVVGDNYWMGRFPVTAAQFAEYVARSGKAPGYPDCLKGLANHPVASVSWHEAMAFCEWLTAEWQRKGFLSADWRVGLPSEAEWEKAARGGERIPPRSVIGDCHLRALQTVLGENPEPKREYPWTGPADPDKANYDETRIGTTSAVGCFPKGASPYGCEDMAGNVWEWTRSRYAKYPYDPGADAKSGARIKVREDDEFVVRGGAFWITPSYMRCACRLRNPPNDRLGNVGFRVVLSPFHDSGV